MARIPKAPAGGACRTLASCNVLPYRYAAVRGRGAALSAPSLPALPQRGAPLLPHPLQRKRRSAACAAVPEAVQGVAAAISAGLSALPWWGIGAAVACGVIFGLAVAKVGAVLEPHWSKAFNAVGLQRRGAHAAREAGHAQRAWGGVARTAAWAGRGACPAGLPPFPTFQPCCLRRWRPT
jgi:hypothetical protein